MDKDHKIIVARKTLFSIIILILLLGITIGLNKLLFSKQNPLEIPIAEIIYSEEIVNSSKSNDDDQFWATMYRRDQISNKIFFVVNRQENLVKEVIGADSHTFKVIASSDGDKYSYALDKNGVYCNEIFRPDISSLTFKVNRWSALYAFDANYVYVNCEILIGADPQTFTRFDTQGSDSLYAKDKNRVYYNGIPIQNADPVTFKIISSEGYSGDDKHIYFKGKLVGQNGYKIGDLSDGKMILSDYKDTRVIFEGAEKSYLVNLSVSPYWGSSKLVVHRGKIYFIDRLGALNVFDPVTDEVNTLSLGNLVLLDTGDGKIENTAGIPKINDFFVENKDIYFLYGNNCNNYLAKCNVELMKYNMDNFSLNSIISNIDARDIVGFDEMQNNIYLRWAEGDAGCFWSHTDIISIDQKSVIGKQEASACKGDSDYETENKKLENPTLTNDIIYSDAVYFKDGKIIFPNSDQNKDYRKNVYYLNN